LVTKGLVESATSVPGPVLPRWQKLVALTGILIWALALVGLALLWTTGQRTQATAAFLAVATFYYAGQFGAMPLGLAAGGEPWVIALYVWAADAAGLFVFFPLTQYSVDRLHGHPGLVGRWIQRLRQRATHRREFIERYGPWGLFGFTLLPFLFNSPILGAVLGRVVGLPSRKTLLALASAVTLMSVIWVAIFSYGLEAAAGVDRRLPWVLGLGSVVITVLVALVAGAVRLLQERRARRVYSK
jgi:uncharacterized membrane protein